MQKFKLHFSAVLAAILLLCAVFSSCSDKQDMEWICNCEQQKKVADFVSANTKPANNMSDEEMEDVITELRRTGVKLHCKQRLMWQDREGNIDWKKEKLDTCQVWIDMRWGQ